MPAEREPASAQGEHPAVAGNTTHTRPENRVAYPALDGLRAVAFLLVFFQHYKACPWGWTGVDIFFVLSGFLITGILWDTRDDEFRARNFYVRRTLRIFPLYWGLFLLLLLLTPLAHWQWHAGWWAWPLYAGNYLRFLTPETVVAGTTAQRIADAQLQSGTVPQVTIYLGHFWSLCVEEQFYLLWPWVVFYVRSRRALLWICSVAVVLGPIARVVTQYTAPPWLLGRELLTRALPFQVDALLLGGLLALLWRGAHREKLLRWSRWLAPAGLLTAVVYIVWTLPPDLNVRAHYQNPAWRLTWGQEFVNVLSGALILVCAGSTGPVFRVLHWRPLRWLGRLSYGAYVFHDIPHGLFIPFALLVSHNGTTVEWIVTAMGLVTTIVLACLSFRFIETPFLSKKDLWTRRDSALVGP